MEHGTQFSFTIQGGQATVFSLVQILEDSFLADSGLRFPCHDTPLQDTRGFPSHGAKGAENCCDKQGSMNTVRRIKKSLKLFHSRLSFVLSHVK
jgi:hypothetical protein